MLELITVVMIATSPGGSTQVVVPKTEFNRAEPEPVTALTGCDSRHLHARNFSDVLPLGAVDLPENRIPDPNQPKCGYGRLKELRIFTVPKNALPGDSDRDGVPDVLDAAPNDADADDDGVPDGMTDSDLDGLTDEFEIQVSMTDPSKPDSNMNGTPDIVEYGIAEFETRMTHVPLAFGALNFSGLSTMDMQAVVPGLNSLAADANLRFVPQVYMENVNEDKTGGTSDGVVSAPDERFFLEQHFNSWLANTYDRGWYVGFGAPNYSPSTSNSRGYSRSFQPSVFVRANLSDDLKVAFTYRYSLIDLGLREPPAGSPEDVDSNVLVAPSRLESFVNMNGLSQLMLSSSSMAFLGIENPFRAFGRQTEIDGLDVFQVRYGFGSVVDAYKDSANIAYADLDYASAYTEEGSDDVIFAAQLYDRLPATGVTADVRFSLDTDGDLEPELEYTIERSRGVGEKTVARLFSRDFRTFVNEPEREPFRLSASYRWDDDKLGAGELYLFHVSKAQIGATVDTVPVDVFVHDEMGTLRDQASFDFMLDRYDMDPSFQTLGPYSGYGGVFSPAGVTLGGVEYAPGQTVAFSFSTLTPLTSFDLLVDDTIVLQNTTDASGDFSGNFVVPMGAVAGKRFLTAVDANQVFAGTVLIVPEPGAAGLALGALAVLAGLRQRRSRPRDGWGRLAR